MGSADLVEYIVEGLVDEPDQIRIETIAGDEETVIELRVAEGDVGKVIGKNGSVARAIRTLLNARAVKDKENATLEIID